MRLPNPRRTTEALICGVVAYAAWQVAVWNRSALDAPDANSAKPALINIHAIYDSCLTRDGDRYVARVGGRGVVLRRTADHHEIDCFNRGNRRITALAASADRRRFVAVDDAGEAYVLVPERDRWRTRRLCSLESRVQNCSLSAGAEFAAFACADGCVDVRNLTTGQRKLRLKCSNSPVDLAVYSTSGKLLVSVTRDQQMLLWDATTGTRLREFVLGETRVRCLAFAPSGDRFFTGGSYGRIGIWRFHKSSPERAIRSNQYEIVSIAVSRNGKRFATGDIIGNIVMRGTSKGQPLGRLPADTGVIQSLQFGPDDAFLYFAGTEPELSRVSVGAFAGRQPEGSNPAGG